MDFISNRIFNYVGFHTICHQSATIKSHKIIEYGAFILIDGVLIILKKKLPGNDEPQRTWPSGS